MVSDQDEATVLAAGCKAGLDLSSDLGDAYRYAHLSLCVLDAVFSIGVRYEGTAAVVRRYAEWAGLPRSRPGRQLPPVEDQQPIGQLVEHIESLGPDRFASEVVRNRQRTSSRSGILKAEASLRFARALDDAGVRTLQDVTAAATDPTLDAALRAIPGHSSGIAIGYFFMLTGDDNLVKPDRMILRYLSSVLGRPVAVTEATQLIRDACRLLNEDHPHLTIRSLDYAIWNHQRTLPAVEATDRAPSRGRRNRRGGTTTDARPWTTFYDLPGRRVLFCAGAGPGHGHWGGVELDGAVSNRHCSVYRDDTGSIVLIDAVLDAGGIPISVPTGFNIDLMGSPTIWPAMVPRYVWHFEAATIIGEVTGASSDPFALYRPDASSC